MGGRGGGCGVLGARGVRHGDGLRRAGRRRDGSPAAEQRLAFSLPRLPPSAPPPPCLPVSRCVPTQHATDAREDTENGVGPERPSLVEERAPHAGEIYRPGRHVIALRANVQQGGTGPTAVAAGTRCRR